MRLGAQLVSRAPHNQGRAMLRKARLAFRLTVNPRAQNRKVAVGFEPTNYGFAIRPLRPLGHATMLFANRPAGAVAADS